MKFCDLENQSAFQYTKIDTLSVHVSAQMENDTFSAHAKMQTNKLFNFDTNDSDMNFILLQRRFDASCIIFKLQVRTIRITITFN